MSLVNPKQYIISARSNGYKDTAYAIAELADNSMQAGAKQVEVIIFENKNRSIDEIAIVDNGHGMSKELLASALGFGESGRDKDKEGNLQNDDTQGMGKFGMGLPNASVSQCKRVQVWSWKSLDEINYSYLDVQEIIDGEYTDLPEPIQMKIPQKYSLSLFDGVLPESGTIVLWSNLDKLKWKRAKTLFEKSEFEVGRMYRRFIGEGTCSVKFKVCDLSGNIKESALHPLTTTGEIKANDPLYLTENSSLMELPGLHTDESQTFFTESECFPFEVEYMGKTHEITIRSAIARNEVIQRMLQASDKNKAGETIWGRHCEKNMGLSVLRARREIEMITNEFFAKSDLYTIRFMGVEIEIPPSLDEVFGVTNNKQHAHNLKDISKQEFWDSNTKLTNKEEIIAYLKSIGEEDTAILYDVSKKLSTVISNAKGQISKTLTLSRVAIENVNPSEDDKPTIAIDVGFKKREEENPGGTLSKDADYDGFKKTLEDEFGYDEKGATEAAKKMEDLKSRISIQYRKTSNKAFFEVENLQGITVLIIDPEHEVYKYFLDPMQEKDKLLFKVMLGAWARLEDETHVRNVKRQLERARSNWGEIIEDMFAELDLRRGDES